MHAVYRVAALKCHPDKAPEAERHTYTSKFQLVGEAFSILSDPDKRAKFDAGWLGEEIQQGRRMDENGRYSGFF